MSSQIEKTFLSLLHEYPVLVSKGNTKEMILRKTEGWRELKEKLFAATGVELTVEQLKKKWNNVQSKVKENNRKRKLTGGGENIPVNEEENVVLDIIGDNNPKIVQCPGAISSISAQKSNADSATASKEVLEKLTTALKKFKIQRKEEEMNQLLQERLEIERERLEVEKKRLKVEKQRLKIELFKFQRQYGNCEFSNDLASESFNLFSD